MHDIVALNTDERKDSLGISRRFSYKSAMLNCPYISSCSGCDWLLKSYDEQRSLKIENLRNAWRTVASAPMPEPRFVEISEGGLRDRADLVFDARSGSPRLGLFDRTHAQIVDLESCPQLSPALESWHKDFRAFRFPIERGSVRLRVSPTGMRGAWLDFANIDVKNLLDERKTLDQLRAVATIEIGQRRKRLVERNGELKLVDAILEPWFETWADDRPVPLYCTIGSFTQPGFKANRALVNEVAASIRATGARHAFEFGAGIGNFTLPLASHCEKVEVFEVDALSLLGLARSLGEAGLNEKVEIHRGDFQVKRRENLEFKEADLMLVDPPRSGLKEFLAPLEQSANKPKHFVYVSCFPESFIADSRRLVAMGYEPKSFAIVDQFPQSRHYEVVARFELT